MFAINVRSMCLGLALGVLTAGVAVAADTVPPAKAGAKVTEPAKGGTAVPQAAKPAPKPDPAVDEVAVMETTKGKMVIEFWGKEAPQTVANFKKLSRQGFYDGTGFHRIIKSFMIQGGDPKSKNPNAPDLGTGDPGYKINDEFNSHKHVKGVISMAHSADPNSGGSQFFVMHGTGPSLDGGYTAFGHLIEGSDVLDAIANTPVGPNPMMGGEMSKPREWTTLKSVKIMSKTAYVASKTGQAASEAAKAGMSGAAGAQMKAGDAKAGQAVTEAKAAAAKVGAKAAADTATAKVSGAK